MSEFRKSFLFLFFNSSSLFLFHSAIQILKEVQPTRVSSRPSDFLPVVLQMGVALAFVCVSMWATHQLGPKRKTLAKLVSFESGIESIGNARAPFSVKYFLIAILFVLFDVEVIFMYPWAVNFKELGVEGLWEMITFMAFLLLGFIYIVRKGALDWE